MDNMDVIIHTSEKSSGKFYYSNVGRIIITIKDDSYSIIHGISGLTITKIECKKFSDDIINIEPVSSNKIKIK